MQSQKPVVFVEHQSTKNKNMPFRFLEYAVYAIRVLAVLADQNRFSEKLMDFPKIADIWSKKECVDVFRETYCYDDQLREEGMEKGTEKEMEKGMELSTLIFSALRENVPLPAIAKKHGITVQQVEKMREAFAI